MIKWESQQIEDRAYDALGRLTNVDRPFVDEVRSYDAGNRLTGLNNTNVGNLTYTYDLNGNKQSETWSGVMSSWNFTTVDNGAGSNPGGYDAEDRFVRFNRSGQSETLNLTRSDIGNITNFKLNGTDQLRSYSGVHELTGIDTNTQTFNTDGQLTTSHTGMTLSWNERGFMKQNVVPSGASSGIEGTNEYGYDGEQKRVWKKITRSGSVAEHTVYIYAGPNCIAEYIAGSAAASPDQEYVYGTGIDSLAMIVRSSGTQKLTVTRNQQWSVVALADHSDGTILERYTYDALGKHTILAADGTTVRTSSSYGNPYGYTSRRHDTESGLMYFRARYYDSTTGEFTSKDPLEYVDGMSLYRGYFVPRGVDPSGLDFIIPEDPSTDTTKPLIEPEGLDTFQILYPQRMRPSVKVESAKMCRPKKPSPAIVACCERCRRGDFFHSREADEQFCRVVPTVVSITVSIVFEPYDYYCTGCEIWNDPTSPWPYVGFIPFVPSVAGKAARKITLFRVIDETEFACVLREGNYGLNPHGSGKYFFFDESDMRRFKASKDNCNLTTCTSIQVPSKWIDEGEVLDLFGEGKAIHFQDHILLEMYDGMCLPKIIESDNIPIFGGGRLK